MQRASQQLPLGVVEVLLTAVRKATHPHAAFNNSVFIDEGLYDKAKKGKFVVT